MSAGFTTIARQVAVGQLPAVTTPEEYLALRGKVPTVPLILAALASVIPRLAAAHEAQAEQDLEALRSVRDFQHGCAAGAARNP